MDRKIWLGIILVMVVGLMVACAPAAPAEEPTEEPMEEPTEEPMEEPTAEPTAEAPAEPEVSLLIWADETRAPVLEPLVAAFQDEYGVAVQIQQLGFGDIRDQMKVAGPAGEGPDIFIGAHDWLGELVANGLVAEVDLGDKEASFLPAAVVAFTYDGKLYGMPYATENVALVYNPEIIGDTPPATWEEVYNLSAAGPGYAIQTADPYHWNPMFTAFGGYVFGVTDQGYNPEDVGIDSEGGIAAGEYLKSLVDLGTVEPGVDYDVMHALFESGEKSMIVTGPWALNRIRESGVPYAVAPIPAGPAGEARPFLGVQGFMVSAFSDDPLLAQVFLTEFVATDATMQALFDADPRPSAWLTVREAITDPDLLGFAEAGANGMPMPAIPEMSSVWTAWTSAQELIINGTEAPDAALATAAEQIRTAIAEGGQ